MQNTEHNFYRLFREAKEEAPAKYHGDLGRAALEKLLSEIPKDKDWDDFAAYCLKQNVSILAAAITELRELRKQTRS